jgi:hypothetical protein
VRSANAQKHRVGGGVVGGVLLDDGRGGAGVKVCGIKYLADNVRAWLEVMPHIVA